jgi:ribosomal protein S18 acetylase RimI-like enzyme
VPRSDLIREAVTVRDVGLARALFEEYAAAIGVDLCFQGFADELAALPGAYAPPRGRLLLAGPEDAPQGCIALRPLAGSDAAAPVGEVKRLYVRTAARGAGLGRTLAEALIAEARAIGYRELRLDTLPTMSAARALYASLGFRESAAYYPNPLPGALYMSLAIA